MRTGALPSSFHAVRTSGAVAFARPEAMTWLRARLGHPEGVHGAALEEAEALLRGRGPVPVVPAPGDGSIPTVARPSDVGVPWRAATRWAVRHYHRGGAVAPLLTDRYLRMGTPRPFLEAAASEEVGRRGLATPAVVAGAVYPSGIVYRADLVTAFVPETRDLAALLFRPGGTADGSPPFDEAGRTGDGGASHDGSAPDAAGHHRLDALRRAGRLIARMASRGVRHPDLNAKNVLLREPSASAPSRGPETLLLDLDRCTFSDGPDTPAPLLDRLERSLRKFERTHGPALSEAEWVALRDAAAIGGRDGSSGANG